jgi:hypothetical protein
LKNIQIEFCDAHSHVLHEQSGGFLIGIEGNPKLEGTLTNADALALQNRGRQLIAVPYVCGKGPDSTIEGPIVKYHARREGYSAEWVASDIKRFQRRVVLVDTLNAIDWPAVNYKDLAAAFPDVQFLMCHGGGYDILEFIKYARFMPNVWIDFSATQHIFGWAGSAAPFPVMCEAIDHCMAEPRLRRKMMFGSDSPGFEYRDALEKIVATDDHPSDILKGNFMKLVEFL